MDYQIVMDSAGDLKELVGAKFTSVPLKILAGDMEFVDDQTVDVAGMVAYLKNYTGKAATACPSVGEYMDAFGDAENVFCVTITSGLSGSYGAARAAADLVLEKEPERRVHIFDSLSAGPEMLLLTEKLQALVSSGLDFDEIVSQATAYQKQTHLLFSLESLHNLANNGRVPSAVAKVAGLLGIHLIGKASDEGTLQPIGKARGKKVPSELLKHMTCMGYAGGKVRISHCEDLAEAEELKALILSDFPAAEVKLAHAEALCSFYAESGGLLVGFEG